MKCVLLYFCCFLNLFVVFHVNKAQTFCPGISISFNLTGNYCGISGDIILFRNSSMPSSALAGFANVTKNNFNQDLCFMVNNFSISSAYNNECYPVGLSANDDYFTLDLYLCNGPYEVFQNFSISYNSSGLYSAEGTCYNSFNCNIATPMPTSSTATSTFSISTSHNFTTSSTALPSASTSTSLPPASASTSLPPASASTSLPPASASTSLPPASASTSLPPALTSLPPASASTSLPPTSTSVPLTSTSISNGPHKRNYNSFTPSLHNNVQSKMNEAISINNLIIDDYCAATPEPPSTTVIPTTTSTIFVTSTPNPNEITPPLPVINCSDPNNSYIISQTCAINDTSDPIVISQVINTTSTHIQDKIDNDNLTAANVHDTGIFIYNTVTTVDNLNTDGAHKFLDLTNSIVVQPLDILAKANNITANSLLWYPSSLPRVIAKTEQNLNYSKPDSNILLHSFSLNDSFCANTDGSHEICYSSTSQVLPGSEDAEFCTTFNPKSICNAAQKAYIIMWKSLSFFALVKNNTMNIKNGLENDPDSDQPTTFNNADRCSDGTYYKNNYGSNVGGVHSNGDSIGTGSLIWIKRRDDENDLHITKYRMAKFVATSFEDSGNKVTKKDKHYTAQCPEGMCTLVVDGNPTDPAICSSSAKTTTALLTGIGIFVGIVGVLAVIAQSDILPIVGKTLKIFFSVFGDKNLPMRIKFFACCYNVTFMFYTIYSIFISQLTISDTDQSMCTAFAVVGYVLYISAIFLSVLMLIITLDALGCWIPLLKNFFYIFTGNKRNYIPFVHSYGIPLIITGIFAVALTSFFKRNDGYCWIRPDYAFLALWFPLILLMLTIPFYLILFARRWSDYGFSKIIYIPLTVSDELEMYDAEKKRRDEMDKQEKLKEFTEKLFGKQANDEKNDNEDERDTETVILTNETLARLMVPQIFLAIPLITGWHYLFMLTPALQVIVLNAMDWLEELPEKLEFVRAGFDSLRGKKNDGKPDESKWDTN